MADDGALAAYQHGIEALTAEYLDPYMSSARERPFSKRQKEFNDPIWGTLFLRPEEVLILDSPLLQRLRRIKQLGVVHYVYPAATHTRLEHSLGVVHQVQRMITSLNERSFESQFGHDRDSRVIHSDEESILRMTALCHDVGHGFMSHVSEYGLEHNRSCENLRLALQTRVERPAEPQLSEIAAYFMVGSPAFQSLLELAYANSGRHLPDGIVETMQHLILGMPVPNKVVLLHEFISGPFDADKMDYLARDAFMCGVPNVTDIPRLIQKLRATQVDRERLPAGLKRGTRDRMDGYVVTGISTSGGRTLDEIALARTLLFDKVYRHQKVRAVETMVFAIVEILAEMSMGDPACLPYRLSDDEVLMLDEMRIVAAIERELTAEDAPLVSVLQDISQRLRERRIYSRGFAFASVMTDDDYRHDENQVAGLQRFLSTVADPHRANGFMERVRELVIEIVSVVEDQLPCSPLHLQHYIRLSPPKPAPRGQSTDTGHAQLIEADGTITKVSDDAAETTPWTGAYVATRDLGHVFCPAQVSPHVFIATEATLLEQFGVRIPSSMLHYAKQDSGRVASLRADLDQRGWFNGRSRDLRPVPDVLKDAEASDRMARIAQALQGYWGPARASVAGESVGPAGTVGVAQIRSYLWQFMDGGADIVADAFTVLEKIKIIGRYDVGRAVAAFIDEHPQFREASCAPLGRGKDSSSVLTYFVGDVADEYGLTIRSVEEAVAYDSPILFVDDFVGTGRQATDIVQSWLGVARTADLDEEREPLPENARELLRSHELGFVFAAGTDTGQENFRTSLADMDLNAWVGAALGMGDLPTVESALGADSQAFLDFARGKGHELLALHNGRERDESWRHERALGFGNEGLLIASAFNTPTAALTLLWADGKDWKPLLPRRSKK